MIDPDGLTCRTIGFSSADTDEAAQRLTSANAALSAQLAIPIRTSGV